MLYYSATVLLHLLDIFTKVILIGTQQNAQVSLPQRGNKMGIFLH